MEPALLSMDESLIQSRWRCYEHDQSVGTCNAAGPLALTWDDAYH